MTSLSQKTNALALPPLRWEDAACDLCGERRSRHLFSTQDYRFGTDATRFNVVRCVGCGLVRTNPRPIEADIHRYYHSAFYEGDQTADEALQAMQPRARAMAEHVNRYPRGRLLDIGCFRGEFMEHMRREHGWEVAGIEFSSQPPNFYGLDIFVGDMAEAPFPENSFDVVTIWAVLEHVYHPSATLRHARRFLKPGGTVIVLVPNYNSIPARIMHHDDVPRHLTMFTRRTLRRMLLAQDLKPTDWSCGQDLCGGSVRGWLNFLVKRAAGEPMGDIQAQNRSLERWREFAACIKGRESGFMRKVDAFDIWLSPRLDRLMDGLGFGFIMTVHAQRS